MAVMDFTYLYSQLSPESVASLVTDHYELAGPIQCKFYILGLHDNYLIETGGLRYIFRIYRNRWRSLEEINFELDLLAYLDDKSAPVAAPLRNQEGELKLLIDCPEGQRVAALFSYAPGSAAGLAITSTQSEMLGQVVAQVHRFGRDFTSTQTRPLLELPYLLDASVEAIVPYLNKTQRHELEGLQHRIRDGLPALPYETDVYGICQGDVNLSNFHIDDNQRITLFDFDQCGFGFRAFEIGKFFSCVQGLSAAQSLRDAFLEGYQHIRQLSMQELNAIPYYEVVAIIWVMAIHVYNADRIGHKQMEAAFWERRLARLQTAVQQLPS